MPARDTREEHRRTVEPEVAPGLLPERPLLLEWWQSGAGSADPSRRWPADSFARLGDRLVELWQARIVLTGSDQERPLTASVQRFSRLGLTSGPHSFGNPCNLANMMPATCDVPESQ